MEVKYPFTPVPSTLALRNARQASNSSQQPPDKGKPAPLSAPDSNASSLSAGHKKIYGFLMNPVNPLPLFFMFILIRTLASEIHNKNKEMLSIANLRNSISQAVFNPETINMLLAVSPYLDVPEQEGLYTIVGILEAIQILNGIQEGSYQAQRMQQMPVLSLGSENKGLGVIKALKDYMPDSSRPLIDRAIQIHESMEKLLNNMKIYRNNLKIAGNDKPTPIEDLGQIIRVIKPILPDEQQSRLERFQKAIQLVQIMDLDEMIKNRGANASQKDDKEENPMQSLREKGDITSDIGDNDEGRDQYRTNNESAPGDARRASTSDGQDQSLETLVKLIQLLMQASAKEQ